MANTAEVLIVGAGVSGLRCAKELRDTFGLTVKVLEARSKIGGRVQQDDTFLPGRQIEVGAEFIHGDVNPVVEMCEEHGWRRRHIFTWSHGDGGPAHEPAPDGGIGYYYLGAERQMLRYDSKDPDMIACHEALWRMGEVDPAVAEADTRTLRQYLVDEGVPERMLGLACAGYGNTAGGTMDTVPVSRAMRFERAWHGDGTELDPDFRLEPSYGVVIQHLAAGLDIAVNSPVARILVDTAVLEENAREVQAKEEAEAAAAAAGSGAEPTACSVEASAIARPAFPSKHAITVITKGGEVYRAHRVVVSVPLPVLREEEITFVPPLEPAKVAAAKSMSFANGVKVALKFKKRAWPANCHGVVCADSFIPEMWMNSSKGVGGIIVGNVCTWMNQEGATDEVASMASSGESRPASTTGGDTGAGALPVPTGRHPHVDDIDEPGTLYTVTGFLMGVRADTILAEHSQSVIIARALSQLTEMFGMSAHEHFLEGFVHNWAGEEYIRGAYSTPTHWEQSDASRKLAEPHLGAVFFAGEATAGAVDGWVRQAAENKLHYASPIVLHGAMQTGSGAACNVARSIGFPVTCVHEDHVDWMPSYLSPGQRAAQEAATAKARAEAEAKAKSPALTSSAAGAASKLTIKPLTISEPAAPGLAPVPLASRSSFGSVGSPSPASPARRNTPAAPCSAFRKAATISREGSATNLAGAFAAAHVSAPSPLAASSSGNANH